MAVLRIIRFEVEPERAEEMQKRRIDLITATKAGFPGLVDTRLARVDERTWIDVWKWESAAQMQAAVDAVASIPEAGAAFQTVATAAPQVAEIVDER